MSGNSKSPTVRPISHPQSTGSASPRSPLSPFGSPPMGYFEEPQNEPSSPPERQSKWGSLPIRTSSKSPRPKHRSSSSSDGTAPTQPPPSPKQNRSRHSGTFSDVGRHGNEWLFGGYGPRDLVQGPRDLVNSMRSSNK